MLISPQSDGKTIVNRDEQPSLKQRSAAKAAPLLVVSIAAKTCAAKEWHAKLLGPHAHEMCVCVWRTQLCVHGV